MVFKRFALFVFLYTWMCTFDGTTAFNLQISPERARLNQNNQSWVTIMCTADIVLDGCQFSWWAEKDSPGPLINLSGGPKSVANRSHLSKELVHYEYAGRGLAKGDCGIKMKLFGKKLWTVGCRAKGTAGGWKYAWMDLIAYATDPLPNVVSEQSMVVAFPGQDLNIMCSTTQPVDSCYFSVPGVPGWLDFARGLSSKDSKGRLVCRGQGAAAGQCGLSLHKVAEEDNGPVRCYIWKSPKYADNRAIHVIVAKPPSAPRLEIQYSGGRIIATCSVTGSRPVVDLRWVVGDVVVRNDENNDADASLDDEWTWPWSPVNITQKYVRELQDDDYGKSIQCVVSHVAIQYPIELSQVISNSTVNKKSHVINPVAPPTTRTREVNVPSGCDEAASCPQRAEYCSLKMKEVRYAAEAAALAVESNRVTLEAARKTLQAEEARVRAEEARAREEEAWEKNAAEELLVDQERRNKTLKELRRSRR